MQVFLFYSKYLKNCGHGFLSYAKNSLPSKNQEHLMMSLDMDLVIILSF